MALRSPIQCAGRGGGGDYRIDMNGNGVIRWRMKNFNGEERRLG